MESRQERIQRENRHFKKKMKKSAHLKNKLKRMLQQDEEQFRKNKMRNFLLELNEDVEGV